MTKTTKCPGSIGDPTLRICDLPAGHVERGQPWCLDRDGQRFQRQVSAPLSSCVCGEFGPALTPKEIKAYNKLREREITVCPACGHEVMAPETSHDVRKIGAIGDRLAHKACAQAQAPRCAEWVNEPGTVLGRQCARKATTTNRGKPVCSWHREGRIFRESA